MVEATEFFMPKNIYLSGGKTMKTKTTHGCRRVLAMLLTVLTVISMFSGTALAAQPTVYRDPAEHWMSAGSRTNELDTNAVITHETFNCRVCGQYTSFTIWRTPEYTRDGQTALTRNVKYSDGTMVGGEGTGTILDGTPSVDAYYTGYHWTKAMCDTCGTMNSNGGTSSYDFGKNVYNLYDCAAGFSEDLDDVVTYEYADDAYHTKTVEGGHYCEFCFGTVHTHTSTLERHNLKTEVKAQLDKQRFAVVKTCADCGYTSTEYVAAKSVVADYYGAVDGKAHTLTVSDLSESGVSAKIRYGNSADACTLVTPPSYTEEGQYTVYYAVTYTYKNVSMTENGVAYVWLHDESVKEPEHRNPDIPASHDSTIPTDSAEHKYSYLDTVAPTCTTLGYDRYLCSICGAIEKRNYQNATGHAYQSIVIREADCDHEGKVMEICRNCGEVKETVTPKGEHQYKTYTIAATCTAPGYTVKECSICGDRQITGITQVKAHNYQSYTVPATCESEGRTVQVCADCGQTGNITTVPATGHNWDNGTVLTDPGCLSDGVTVYRCTNCNAQKYEKIPSTGHTHGKDATCTEPEVCPDCGAVLTEATGHNYKTVKTPATCLKMGYTTYTCQNCGASYKSDYTEQLGHNYKAVVTKPTCESMGYTTYTCDRCGDSYVDDYTEALGHDWDNGTKITDATCNGEGVIQYGCTRCDETYLEAVSPKGHNPGPEATCTEAQVCHDCGAVLKKATGHSYEVIVTDPTCTEMGYTTYTCKDCGDNYKADYTNPTGHKPGDWIVDREPTIDDEGLRHKECENCGETVASEAMEKLYNSATTDSKGEAVVGGYLVIVTDTDSKAPISNAAVVLNRDDSISIVLPNGRILDYNGKTTVTVLLKADKSPVSGLDVSVTDKNGNFADDTTGAKGAITVPSGSNDTGNSGKGTVGYEDSDKDPYTITVKVIDATTGRPIDGAAVTIGKTGNITVILPDGTIMDENNRITIIVTDNEGKPLDDVTIIVKDDEGYKETGKSDEDGTLTVPEIARQEKHGAYIYGYPDGTFGPERNMTRSEAAAIFARLLAEKKGDNINPVSKTKFEDIPSNAWYSGYVKYLTGYGIVYGTGNEKFSPNEAITRAEFVTMAVRFFEAYGDGNAKIMEQYVDFTDVSSGYWAAEYIRDAAIHGWIKGYGDGTFRAAQNITRAEVVTIVNRLLDRTADEAYIAQNLRKLNTFSDMKETHWAYYDVMESANAHTATYEKAEIWSK